MVRAGKLPARGSDQKVITSEAASVKAQVVVMGTVARRGVNQRFVPWRWTLVALALRLADVAIRRPWWVIVGALLLALATAGGAWKRHCSRSPSVFRSSF